MKREFNELLEEEGELPEDERFDEDLAYLDLDD